MFATFVVGSLPRPVWVRELIERRKRGEVSPAAAARMLDDAVPAAIRMQEAAGLDFVSDGEWRRESYVKVFADAVAGFEPDLIAGGRGAAYPAVTADATSGAADRAGRSSLRAADDHAGGR